MNLGAFAFIYSRQVDRERSSTTDRALKRNMAPVLLDDSVDRGQTESCPLANILRREKWIEDARHGARVHPGAGVSYRQPHVRPDCCSRVLARVGTIHLDVGSLDSEPAPLRHRIARICGQVHENLLELGGIGLDAAEGWTLDDDQHDGLADQRR